MSKSHGWRNPWRALARGRTKCPLCAARFQREHGLARHLQDGRCWRSVYAHPRAAAYQAQRSQDESRVLSETWREKAESGTLMSRTKKELQSMLKELGYPSKGDKSTLAAMLKMLGVKEGEGNGVKEVSKGKAKENKKDVYTPPGYRGLTHAGLRRYLSRAGLSSHGSKRKLLLRARSVQAHPEGCELKDCTVKELKRRAADLGVSQTGTVVVLAERIERELKARKLQ